MTGPEHAGDTDMLLPARLASRLAAVSYAGLAGLVVLLNAALLPYSPGERRTGVAAGAALIAIGAIVWYLPWQRWPRRTLLLLIPMSLAIMAVLNLSIPVDPYRYGIYAVLIFGWIGLTWRQGTALAALPLLAPAYLLPLAATGRLARDSLAGFLYIALFCLLQGEGLAWLVARLMRTQQALETREAHYRALSEGVSDVVSVVDAQGRFTYVSPSVRTVMGLEPDALLGRPFFDRLHPDDQRAARERLARGLSSRVETRSLHADGSWRWMEHTIRDARGDPLLAGYITTSRDISERKATEHALRVSEQRFRSLVEEAPIGILIADARGVLEAVNPALCSITGYAPEDLLGQPFTAFVPSDEATTLAQVFQERFAERGRVEDEYEIPTKDGRLLTLLSAAIFLTDPLGEPRRAAFLIDITERKREEQADQQRARAAEELAQMRSDFVASVTHELRTPLTAIIGFAELLQAHWTLLSDAQRQEQIDHIVTAANRQQRLVEDTLLLTQLEGNALAMRTGPSRVLLLVQRAAEELEGSYPGQRVDLDGPADLCMMADRDRAVQILVNLLDNAAKYSPDGSPITVTWKQEDGSAMIRVRDSGSGVPEEGRQLLFTRFGRLAGSKIRAGRVGTGLGLYLGQCLAQAMGGDLELESTGPDGSTFLLRLPIAGTRADS